MAGVVSRPPERSLFAVRADADGALGAEGQVRAG